MRTAICTLAEKDYHFGGAALINSLYKSGFDGAFYYGYRGELPRWAKDLNKETSSIKLDNGMEVFFVHLDTPVHFTHYKSIFMQSLIKGPAKDCYNTIYMDPDMVVKCKWKTIQTWSEEGIAVCEDSSFNYLPMGHPKKKAWQGWIKQHPTFDIKRPNERYFNAGFISCPNKEVEFLKLWENLLEDLMSSLGADNQMLQHNSSEFPFWQENPYFLLDQDAMNMALLCYDYPVNVSGCEGMDFGKYGYLLSHAAGSEKPWRGGFIKRAFSRKIPSRAQKYWAMFINGPIEPYQKKEKLLIKLDLRIGGYIGAFLGGTDNT